MMLNWFKKKRVLPKWRLIGILMIAILFGMTLQLSLGSGSYEYAILVALCGLGFAYDIK